MLFINADDWGWTKKITDSILICYHLKKIHTASAMTFMQDSERGAELALANGLSVGLHLNLTQDFTGNEVASTLRSHHRSISVYLKSRKINQIIFNPFLHKSVDYVFKAQWEEFYRLYGETPSRLDGHHHMHLCMNMLAAGCLPKGIKIRRNFTFRPGEKHMVNRLYRYLVDRWLKSRFQCTDFFFSMTPIDRERIQQIVLLSKSTDVELMVHPGVETEYSFLLSPEWAHLILEAAASGGII